VKGAPIEHRVTPGDAELCYFEWGSPRAGEPTWLFCHATGFHARCWDKVIAQLPEGAHAIAVDARGHGRSAKVPPFVWESFGSDLVGLIEALDLPAIIGVGHSMGGHALTQAIAHNSSRFERAVLVDPVIFDPTIGERMPNNTFADASEHPVARRKSEFESWQAMYERFADRSPYSLWRADVLKDYCEYGVLPAEDSDAFTLACPPVVEASVYMGSTDFNLMPLLKKVGVPVTVLRARARELDAEGLDFTTSPTWFGLADALPDGVDIHLPELTHFIAMQAPELVARCAISHITARAELEDLLVEFSS